MLEVRFKQYKDELLDTLETLDLQLIEEDLKGEVTYIIYCNGDQLQKFVEFIRDPQIKDIEETGWETKWKEFLKPGNLTPHIKYIFEEADRTDDKAILINPSFAFGTGTHPTTQLAALLLEEVCANKLVLDIGTGSGILSLAARLSGATKVYSFDNDAMAMKNTKENILLNHGDNLHIWAGDINSVRKDARIDIVVANIISSVLLSIKNRITALKPSYIIFSGILDSEKDGFLNDFNNEFYILDKIVQKDGWIGIRYRRLDV